ncbi:MAG: DNA replication/repair protein RecF [Anaerolineales bacterium]|nr:DNA replication/repair protein RecF [Anaerolineales bacterium]
MKTKLFAPYMPLRPPHLNSFSVPMFLKHLSLTNFRSLTRLDVEVPSGTIVLVGDNAQGKTSVLEAIFMLATLNAFNAESDRELINFFTAREPLAVARIKADFRQGDTSDARLHHLELRIIQETNGKSTRVRKEVLFDGVKQKVNEVVGQFNAVLFLPQMMSIIDGSPSHRRRYLDLALAQVIPGYSETLSRYARALEQRNALLKQLNDRSGDQGQLTYWDEQIAGLGARLIHARIHAIQEMEILAALTHRELTQGREVLRLNYQPAYDPLPATQGQYTLNLDDPRDRTTFTLEQIQKGYAAALQKLRREEIARGVTTIGPHRDELRFLSNGVDLGTYGSRGQIRTALLTLKLAEVHWMKQKTGHWPVLLLDEVLAELDGQRRTDLLTRLVTTEQALMTTTDLNLFAPEFIAQAQTWHIQEGRLSQ